MDNDSIGAALRVVRGLDVSDADLSVDVIRDCCLGGPGHFLARTQTMERMEKDFYYPRLNDRMSPMEWEEKGKRSAFDRAADYVGRTLSSHCPSYTPEDIGQRNRVKFPVRLPRENMRP